MNRFPFSAAWMSSCMLLAASPETWAAKAAPPVASKPPAKARQESERRFVDSCTRAFEYSTPGHSSEGVGKSICECTAHESRHEGVKPDALDRETAHIKADPKHKIEDEKLLNAFHYCSIQVLQAGG